MSLKISQLPSVNSLQSTDTFLGQRLSTGETFQVSHAALIASLSGGGGSTTWGMITGSISNQIDLQSSLASKLNSSQVTNFGLSLIDDTDASVARTTLGLGTAATTASTAYAPAVHNHVIGQISGLQTALDAKATPADVTAAVSALVDASPATLDTLNELAAALGDDPNFATTMTTALAGKAPTSHTHVISDTTGLQTALDGKQVAGSYSPAVHNHVIGQVTGLQTSLDAKQPLTAVLTNTTAAFTVAQESKLSGIATGATSNSSDVTLLNRTNHTGVQDISTVTGLQAALDGKLNTTAAVGWTKLTVGTTTPSSPSVGDLWVDTN